MELLDDRTQFSKSTRKTRHANVAVSSSHPPVKRNTNPSRLLLIWIKNTTLLCFHISAIMTFQSLVRALQRWGPHNSRKYTGSLTVNVKAHTGACCNDTVQCWSSEPLTDFCLKSITQTRVQNTSDTQVALFCIPTKAVTQILPILSFN